MTRICERLFLLLLTLITLLTVVNAQTQQDTPPPQSYLPANAVAWFYGIGALASALASVVAWRAKLGWADEFARAKDETIKALQQNITSLKMAQDETMKAREERIQTLKEHNDMLRNVQDERIKNKDDAIAQLKMFSSPDFMKSLVEQREQLQHVVEERNRDIEKLRRQVKESPLDATELALKKDKLELEKDILALTQAYAMRVSLQRSSDKGASVEDEGKIRSAMMFIERLGAAAAVHTEVVD